MGHLGKPEFRENLKGLVRDESAQVRKAAVRSVMNIHQLQSEIALTPNSYPVQNLVPPPIPIEASEQVQILECPVPATIPCGPLPSATTD